MFPVSDRFLQEIRRSHFNVVKAYLINTLGETIEVEILGGEITEDKSALIRRRASVMLSGIDPNLVLPSLNNYEQSPLWPIGTGLRIEAGLRYNDGTEELVPLGIYRLSKPTISHNGSDVQITVDAYDYSRTMSRNQFTDQYWIAKDTDVSEAIKALVKNRLPFIDEVSGFKFMATDGSNEAPVYTTGHLIFSPQDNPWEKVTDMAKSIGAEIYFNGLGQCVLRPEPDPLYTPSQFDYIEGEEATFTGITRSFDDEQAYNGVIATGQSTNNTNVIPRGEAWDTNPESPTYYDPTMPELSNYGAVPYFMVSDYIVTNAQAQAAAESQLLKVIGVVEQVTLDAVCNPAHEAGDVLAIYDQITGVQSNYILESYRLSLGPEASMSGTTKKRRST